MGFPQMGSGRAVGNKEDARTLDFYLEALITKISQYKTDLINSGQTSVPNQSFLLSTEKPFQKQRCWKNLRLTIMKWRH
jgi:hypothetical protein